MKDQVDPIAKRLRQLRMKKGMTLKEVARKIGVPESTYRDWEYGRSIQGEPYVLLAQVFDVSVYELLTGEQPKVPHLFHNIDELKRILYGLEGSLRSLM